MPEITLEANADKNATTWDIEIWAADHAGNVMATIPILKGMRSYFLSKTAARSFTGCGSAIGSNPRAGMESIDETTGMESNRRVRAGGRMARVPKMPWR